MILPVKDYIVTYDQLNIETLDGEEIEEKVLKIEEDSYQETIHHYINQKTGIGYCTDVENTTYDVNKYFEDTSVLNKIINNFNLRSVDLKTDFGTATVEKNFEEQQDLINSNDITKIEFEYDNTKFVLKTYKQKTSTININDDDYNPERFSIRTKEEIEHPLVCLELGNMLFD